MTLMAAWCMPYQSGRSLCFHVDKQIITNVCQYIIVILNLNSLCKCMLTIDTVYGRTKYMHNLKLLVNRHIHVHTHVHVDVIIHVLYMYHNTIHVLYMYHNTIHLLDEVSAGLISYSQ